ncbi:motility associated factor glycosyltransferase family protein [Alteromonas sp. ASW11-130]|uniref:motility associated factor glycosyltransferase family protein n=1 Tax=Alteromonas sp. ASW11-130 TaxID=3015775 RepID=UPI0022425749|nr:6-hydroxymethylpterin diphosphokinase MptE-like protein [Alteromonas sp. ASW11-130]MCW8090328.1 DUF115 domain-containing protein [Alteromonas sp. ASW11-130]
MLKNVFFHVDEDKEVQNAIERQASPQILQRERKNLAAFQRFMPPVYDQIFKINNNHISILCNQHSEMNIIDTAEGRTFYGLNPQAEVAQQIDQFSQRALTFTLHADKEQDIGESNISGIDSSLAQKLYASQPASSHIPVLVVLGIGGAMHLPELVKRYQIDHLVIYEPESAYFKCSLAIADWQSMLTLAAEKNTAIYMMLGENGKTLADNLTELSSVAKFDQFTLYKHYNHPVFDELVNMLCELSWEAFKKQTVKPKPITRPEQYLVDFTYPINLSEWSRTKLDIAKFKHNLAAFKKFIPDLYDEFQHYYPEFWFPVANDDGQVNMLHVETMTPFYSDDPQAENAKSIEVFKKFPNNDGLVLNFTGQKLKPYLHYQMVAEVDEVLKEVEEEQRSLPESVKAIILFGIGTGYGFEQLSNENRLEKVFICEPNRDFFYASLFAIDWHDILEKIEREDKRIYLNIGDDGTHLIEDLLTQFHTVGPYLLASTFFYQGYYNKYLTRAIQNLREQLQVIVSLGDYFDHSKYCIAHTRWGMENEIPVLKRDAQQYLTADDKDTPVFIVGNGPSLDNLIDLVEEYKDQAIIISCGTALKTLYKHGITPDFHAEIESNRATYDWTVRVGDLDYLKSITLLSCNGIHPETCGLFKDVYIAFKEGESATVAVSKLFDEFPYTKLQHAYPTVTNFVANFFTEVGFTQLYLIGVDLGFIDVKHHHSKMSGYYSEEGEELFDFAASIHTSLRIEGNFRPFVETKYEFKLAITLLEKALMKAKDVYNLNDGAKIRGANPLIKDHVLLSGAKNDKNATLAKVLKKCFHILPTQTFIESFESTFSKPQLVSEMKVLIELFDAPSKEIAEIERLIEVQRNKAISSYFNNKSLLFYYLNGSINFISSVLMKTANLKDTESALRLTEKVKQCWRNYLSQYLAILEHAERDFCHISSVENERRQILLTHYFENNSVCIDTLPAENTVFTEFFFRNIGISPKSKYSKDQAVTLIWEYSKPFVTSLNSLIITTSQKEFLYQIERGKKCYLLPGDWREPKFSPTCSEMHRASMAIIASFTNEKIIGFLSPLMVYDKRQVSEHYDLSALTGFYMYQFGVHLIALSRTTLNNDELVLIDGTKAMLIPRPIEEKDLVSYFVSEEVYSATKCKVSDIYNSLVNKCE